MPNWAKIKRFLIALHLYLGLVLCTFFAVWFVSGIVMMYYTWPDFRQEERQKFAEPIPWGELKVDPADATRAAGWGEQPLKQSRIGAVLGRPVLRALPEGGRWRAIYLDDGSPVDLTVHQALQVAENVSPGQWIEMDFDWEGSSLQAGYAGGLTAYDRVHFFAAGDGSGRQFAVSADTGEPLLLAGRFFPLAFVAGPGTHYFYIRFIRQQDGFWRSMMYTTATLGFFSALTGLTLGLIFLRWNSVLREPGKALPYVNGWMWWHHALGLVFGVVTLTWALSGFFSWNPGGFFPAALDASGVDKFRGGILSASGFEGVRGLSQVVPLAREIDLAVFEGQTHARVWNGDLHPTRWSQDHGGQWRPSERLDATRIKKAVQRVFPDTTLKSLDLLEEGDLYYYERPEKRRWKSFPVYRAEIEGSISRTFYLEPTSGEVFLTHSAATKTKRWLYQGLHSLDFKPFVIRPFWDVLMIFLLVGGFVLSSTGVVLSWKWLVRSALGSRQTKTSENLQTPALS